MGANFSPLTLGPDDGPVQVRFYIPDNGRDAKVIGDPEKLLEDTDN